MHNLKSITSHDAKYDNIRSNLMYLFLHLTVKVTCSTGTFISYHYLVLSLFLLMRLCLYLQFVNLPHPNYTRYFRHNFSYTYLYFLISDSNNRIRASYFLFLFCFCKDTISNISFYPPVKLLYFSTALLSDCVMGRNKLPHLLLPSSCNCLIFTSNSS